MFSSSARDCFLFWGWGSVVTISKRWKIYDDVGMVTVKDVAEKKQNAKVDSAQYHNAEPRMHLAFDISTTASIPP
jgi:hypothetical protein